MNSLLEQYLTVLHRVGIDNLWHPELEAITQKMSEEERYILGMSLKEEGKAMLAEGMRCLAEAKDKKAS